MAAGGEAALARQRNWGVADAKVAEPRAASRDPNAPRVRDMATPQRAKDAAGETRKALERVIKDMATPQGRRQGGQGSASKGSMDSTQRVPFPSTSPGVSKPGGDVGEVESATESCDEGPRDGRDAARSCALQLLESEVAELRRELGARTSREQLQETRYAALRQDLEALTAAVRLQEKGAAEAFMAIAAKTEELALKTESIEAKSALVMQTSGELGSGLEEVATVVITIEQKLRQEIEVTRRHLDAQVSQLGTELRADLELRCRETAGDLRAVQRAASKDEVEALRVEVEGLKAHGESSADARRCAEDLAAGMLDRVNCVERALERKINDGVAAERVGRKAELAELRKCLQEASAGLRDGPSARPSGATKDAAHAPATADVRQEVSRLAAMVHALGEECNLGAETILRVESEVKHLSVSGRAGSDSPGPSLGSRLEALEDRCMKQQEERCARLAERMEAAEAAVRQAACEILPLAARVESSKAETQRLLRDATPVQQDLARICAEVLDLKTNVATLMETLGEAGSTPSSPFAKGGGGGSGCSTHRSLRASVVARPRVPQTPEGPAIALGAPGPPRAAGQPAELSGHLKRSIESLVSRVQQRTLSYAGSSPPPASDADSVVYYDDAASDQVPGLRRSFSAGHPPGGLAHQRLSSQLVSSMPTRAVSPPRLSSVPAMGASASVPAMVLPTHPPGRGSLGSLAAAPQPAPPQQPQSPQQQLPPPQHQRAASPTRCVVLTRGVSAPQAPPQPQPQQNRAASPLRNQQQQQPAYVPASVVREALGIATPGAPGPALGARGASPPRSQALSSVPSPMHGSAAASRVASPCGAQSFAQPLAAPGARQRGPSPMRPPAQGYQHRPAAAGGAPGAPPLPPMAPPGPGLQAHLVEPVQSALV